MQNLLYSNKSYLMPSNYNELTAKQLIAITALLAIEGMDDDLAQLKAMKILLDKSLYSFFRIPADAKERMLDSMQWVFEDKNQLTEQLLPRYRRNIFSKWYHGPKSEFDNLVLGEFHFTEINYKDFVVDKDVDALNKLIAVLYRRPVKDYNYKLDTAGDARQKFNSNEVDFYAKKIKHWPFKVKDAILTWYDGCREDLMLRYNPVFQGSKGEDNDEGMFGIIRGLSGPVYGPISEVEELNIHTGLFEITKQIEEAKKLESSTPTVK